MSAFETEDADVNPQSSQHPKEIAEETLQLMVAFLQGLEELSQLTAKRLHRPEAGQKFQKLVEGLTTFADSINTVKAILRLEEDANAESLRTLELEFTAILREILTAKETQDDVRVAALLTSRLPEHLARWRTERIPAIVRSRDS